MRHHPFANNEVTQLRAQMRLLEQKVRQLENAQVTTVPIYNDTALFTGDGVDGQIVLDTATNTSQNKVQFRQSSVWSALNPHRTIVLIIDGGGSAITSGIKYDVPVAFDCTIVGWTILADQVGTIFVNLWKDTYTNYPPTVADKITNLTPPFILSDIKNVNSGLVGWTTSIAAGDIIRVNVDSAATITRVTVILDVVTV